MTDLPKRKTNRLECFDYSSSGFYFITFCTRDRRNILGSIPAADTVDKATVLLSDWGIAANQAILSIPTAYPGVLVDKYVIMPNHVHMIIHISEGAEKTVRLSQIIQQTKRRASKVSGQSLWQSHYYDHVIRNRHDYEEIWQYIDSNPLKWSLDRYYSS